MAQSGGPGPSARRPAAPLGTIPTWALDDVPFGIALIEAPGLRIVYSNHVYESWFAADRRPIVGKNLAEALTAAPQVIPIFQRVADGGKPVHFHAAEFKGLQNRPVELPGGITKWDWSVWPVRLSSGDVTHLLVSGYDVTQPALDRLRLAEVQEEEKARLQQAAAEMTALEHRKAEFLRFASHEMRGPLSVIVAYASMLAEGSLKSDPGALESAGAAITAKAEALTRMVEQILEVSRLEDPEVRFEKVTFDIRDAVEEAARRAREAPGIRHAVRVEVSPGPVMVRAERDQVETALANLIDNAIKYSQAGTEVLCQVVAAAGNVEVRIVDRGVGIAEEDLDRLFSRFSRVGDTTAAIPGTGLGLYISRQAARLQGGDVRVKSSPGSGSEFTLVLPVAG